MPSSTKLSPGSPPTKERSSTRKETILNLVEMLLKQNDESNPELEQLPKLEDDRDVPTVDEHLQAAGADSFRRFQKKVESLDKELRNFANASRQLGSSVAILSSAYHLRTRLAQLLFLYHENAADLFPRKIQRFHTAPSLSTQPFAKPVRRRKEETSKSLPHAFTPTVDTDSLDLEDFPQQLLLLAQDLASFLKAVNEFPEFVDESVNISIKSFDMDLKYWASCLREYQGQFRYPAVQRYVHDLTVHMGEHINNISGTLNMFVEVGVPTIRFAQKHGAENLLNLSTVSTFFSGITATAIQYSYDLGEDGETPLNVAVNCFWFASLVFSISAAVNSLLGLTWKQAMYRSPRDRVPWWVLIWIKRSPLVFLVLSVACFSVGLCCFAYASHQHKATSSLTTFLTAITSFGLIAVSMWFASERWIYLRHHGRKWLSDAIQEAKNQFLQLRGMTAIRNGAQGVRRASLKIQRRTKSVMSVTSSLTDKDEDLEAGVQWAPDSSEGILSGITDGSPGRGSRQSRHRPSDASQSPALDSPSSVGPGRTSVSDRPSIGETGSSGRTSRGRELWRNALRTIALSRMPFAPPAVRKPVRKFTTIGPERHSTLQDEVNKPGRLRSRIHALGPRLEALDPIQEFDAHQALVRHLQFSPDGKYLATSSWDRTAIIFKVGDPFTSHRTLAHPQGFVGQVAWSPDSTTLLTKLARGIKVWNAEDGVCLKTMNRGRYVESITWCPGGRTFLSVEGNQVVMLDLAGEIIDEYDFGRMRLHDVAITPDKHRLLGVGPLLESPEGLHPSTSRVEKRLVVYNMDTKQIEHQTPVLNDVRDITISKNTRNGLLALVSYENKAWRLLVDWTMSDVVQAPPQLWKVELVKDRETSVYTARFSLRHTYLPKATVDFAGTSYFGGIHDDLVLCAGKAGDIHIWDTDSGSLLHRIRPQALGGGDLTCIAWNHAMEQPFMFATGSHDGTIRIWSRPPDQHEDLSSPVASLRRTSSPYGFEESRQTESPITQDFDESRRSPLHAHVAAVLHEEPETVPLSKERTVAFAEELTGDIPPRHLGGLGMEESRRS